MTDREFLLSVLADGEEHELSEIIRRSQDERGFGLTVHSRVAELRPLLAPQGKTIVQRSARQGGRARSFYRLVSLAQPEIPSPSPTFGAGGEFPSGVSGDASDGELSLFQIPESARGAYSEAA